MMTPDRPVLGLLDTARMIRFEDLLEKVRGYNPDADLELLRRAYVFSAFEHKGQVRHSGEPYMVHPLEVADFLADMRLDVVAVAAGLLHDVVEDTLTTIERIEELFGAEVAHVVEGVTKISTIPVLVERGASGRELPQDAPGDGRRHPRHHRQAGRPAAQHADAPPSARGPPDQDCPGDPRHLRAHRQPPRDEPGEERARGAVFPLPRTEGVRVAPVARRRAAPGVGQPHRRAEAHHCRQARRGAGGLHPHRRPDQASLQHLAEAATSRRSISSRSTTSSRCGSSPGR